MKFPIASLLIASSFVTCSNAKWPVILNNGEIKDIYHCFYVFFICTDHVGTWPSNQNSCMDYYRRCEDIVENSERKNSQDEVENVNNFETSCKEIFKKGEQESGVYKIKLGYNIKSVYCDMETKGGGWTIIQRRGDFGRPKDYFLRNWTDYKKGFGDPTEDFWLGLDGIHYLGLNQEQQLLITLEDFEKNETSLIVNNFQIGNESSEYAITYKNYNHKIGNSLPHRGTKFSTIDRDNDVWSGNCARKFSGAWWYSACHNSNLNGLYLRKNHTSFGNGINWFHLRGYHYSLKNTVMKVRAKDKRLTNVNPT